MARYLNVGIILIVGLSLLAGWIDAAPALAATEYFVAPSGSDSASGSLAAPFRTIQRCADVAQPGDTCTIRAGTYRETVTVVRSGTAGAPITFRAYPGAIVTLSGADPLTGWSSQGGGRYTTSMPWSLDVRRAFTGDGPQITNDQLFVDGRMMPEARWPNLTPAQQTQQGKCTMAQADGASVAGESSATYTDGGLSAVAAGTFDGAKISFSPGDNLLYTTCDVVDQTTGAVSFQCDTTGFDAPGLGQPGTMLGPSAGNYYYLWGTLAALDAPGEWFRNEAGVVTLWTPDGSAPGSRVEAKRRLWAFDLRGRQYIVLDGLKLFAATVRYSDATEHTTLRNLEIYYPWHFQEAPPLFWNHGTHGVQMLGRYNAIEDSLLAYSPGSIIALGGTQNVARNNVIYETAYMATAAAIVGSVNNVSNPGGLVKNTVVSNTAFISGRLGVAADPGLDILYNDLYRSHLQTSDLGTIYSWGTDGKGSAIAYNLVHDNDGELNLPLRCFGGYGIYLDDNTTNYQIYRNVVWSTTSPGIFVFGTDGAHTPSNRTVANNTVDGSLTAWAKEGQSLSGTTYRNNIAAEMDLHQAGLTADHNREGDGIYVDRVARDYRLRHDSPAVDAGIDGGSPVTDLPMAPVGAPDLGALEYGRLPFVAGALLRERDLSAVTVTCEQTGDDAATCTLGDLPVGRKVPHALQVRIGSSGAVGSLCHTQMDYTVHRGVATCEGVPTNGLSGTQPVSLRMNSDGTWVQRGSIDLGPLALYTVTPASGISAGGTRVTLTGRRFDTTLPTYRRTITLQNDSGSSLYTYQVPVVFDSASLIAAGKLRGDCGDLRFRDGYGDVSYWLEQGCNSAATRVWVRVPVIPAGASMLTMTYGSADLSSVSDGAATFIFFDDFEDGVLSAKAWSVGSYGGVTVSETGGALRIAGQTNDGTKYAEFGAHLEEQGFSYPPTFAIDAELSVVAGPSSFKANVGAADGVMALQGAPAGSPLGKAIAYYAGGWQAVGRSTVAQATFDRRLFSVGYTGDPGSRTVRWMENGDLAHPLATRSALADPDKGYFTYGPDGVAGFDARFDHVRVRAFVFPEPTVTAGAEVAPSVQVTFGGLTCTSVVVAGPTRLICTTPAHGEGAVEVAVRNPSGARAALARGFTYVKTYAVHLPLVVRGSP